MITYKTHRVYVCTNAYPDIGDTDAAVRSADMSDVFDRTVNLGVLKDGRCLPLSPIERIDLATLHATGPSPRFIGDEVMEATRKAVDSASTWSPAQTIHYTRAA